jgi:hypothetical protein
MTELLVRQLQFHALNVHSLSLPDERTRSTGVGVLAEWVWTIRHQALLEAMR